MRRWAVTGRANEKNSSGRAVLGRNVVGRAGLEISTHKLAFRVNSVRLRFRVSKKWVRLILVTVSFVTVLIVPVSIMVCAVQYSVFRYAKNLQYVLRSK